MDSEKTTSQDAAREKQVAPGRSQAWKTSLRSTAPLFVLLGLIALHQLPPHWLNVWGIIAIATVLPTLAAATSGRWAGFLSAVLSFSYTAVLLANPEVPSAFTREYQIYLLVVLSSLFMAVTWVGTLRSSLSNRNDEIKGLKASHSHQAALLESTGSELKSVQQIQQRLQVIQDYQSVRVAWLNAQGRVLGWSKPNALLADTLDSNWLDLLSSEDQERVKARISVCLNSEQAERVEVLLSGRYVMVDILPAPGTAEIRATLCLTDVDKRRRREIRQRVLLERTRAFMDLNQENELLSSLLSALAPEVGDFVGLAPVSQDGKLTRFTLLQMSPHLAQDLQNQLQAFCTLQLGKQEEGGSWDFGLTHALTQGKMELLTELPKGLLEKCLSEAQMAAELKITLGQLGVRSIASIPMRAGNQVLGVIQIISARGLRKITQEDAAWAEDLIWRASHQLAHLRRYSHTRDSLTLKEEFLNATSKELKGQMETLRAQVDVLTKYLGKATTEYVLARPVRLTVESAEERLKILSEAIRMMSQLGQSSRQSDSTATLPIQQGLRTDRPTQIQGSEVKPDVR